ncbi:uncharacterized protein [Typha latifolia]|uniref:uncharacterized protein isoform X4 n=2 Tax=Typha latifolia TaxID=4733 RepID=UPI003C2AAF4A
MSIFLFRDRSGMVSAGSHSMAQQNQEIVPYNPANLPMRRKRGRPRKYDYPGYAPRRRTQLPYPQAIPTQADPHANSSRGPGGQLVHELPNPASDSSHGQHGLARQPVADPTSYSSSSPHGLMGHAAANENASSGHGHQDTGEQAAGNPTASSSHGHFVGHTGNATAAFSHGPHGLAGHAATDPTANSGRRLNGLLGKAVSGILDGTFDSGYLLTVRVGSSGPVFKGVVFDPRISVPLSPENDVAPLLPMLRRNDVPGPAVGVPTTAPVHMPVRPVSDKVTVAQPLQIREPDASPHAHHVSETFRVPKVSAPFSTKRKTRNDDEYATPDTRLSLRSELRAKILQALHTKPVTDANPPSTSAASQQSGQNLTQAISLLGSTPFEGTLDATVESSGGDQTKEMIVESSFRGQTKEMIVESSGGDQTKETTVESSGGDQIKEIIVKSSWGDQTKDMIVESSGGDQTKEAIVESSPGDQTKETMEATKGWEASNQAEELSGQMEQFTAKISDSNRSPDQEEQPNTQISGPNGTNVLSGQTEHPTTQAPHPDGTKGSSGMTEESSFPTKGPSGNLSLMGSVANDGKLDFSGQANQTSIGFSDLNDIKEFPGHRGQPGTEVPKQSSAGEKQEPNIQNSEQALLTEEHKEEPGEDESCHIASQSSPINVEVEL